MDLGIFPDSEDVIRAGLIEGCVACDVVLTSGGVSMGDKDFVKPLLEELGTVNNK